jgi:hypothetical protein
MAQSAGTAAHIATRFVVIAILLMGTATAAPPQGPWLFYFVNRDGGMVYMSTKLYAVDRSYVRVATYITHPNDALHTVAIDLVDCAQRRYALLSVADYDASDHAVKRYGKEGELPPWQPIVNTAFDRVQTLYSGVCGGLTGTPASASDAAEFFRSIGDEFFKNHPEMR